MKHDDVEGASYDARSVALHWTTAGLVLLLWALGQSVDWFPKDFPRIAARSTHIVLGAALGFVVAYRVWWRLRKGARLPPERPGPAALLRNVSHVALYLMLVTAVALGLLNVWVRGDNVFDLFRVPAFEPGNDALRHRVEEFHALAANTLLALAALHAAVALAHEFVLRDKVMRRMWPLRRIDAARASPAAGEVH